MQRQRLEVAIDDIVDAMTVGDAEPVRYFLDLETPKVGIANRVGAPRGDLEETDFDRALEENPNRCR